MFQSQLTKATLPPRTMSTPSSERAFLAPLAHKALRDQLVRKDRKAIQGKPDRRDPLGILVHKEIPDHKETLGQKEI